MHNFEGKSIRERLEILREDAILERLDWENPTCVDCGMHQAENHLYAGRCSECADDLIQLQTGCRFGHPENCAPDSHPDCHI